MSQACHTSLTGSTPAASQFPHKVRLNPAGTKPLPDAELLAVDWEPSVQAMYASLRETAGARGAIDYLHLQHRLNTDPTFNRTVRLGLERTSRNTAKAIETAVLSILHPYQAPLSLLALQVELSRYGLSADHEAVQRLCRRLFNDEQLWRFANPFKGNQLVYCSTLYRAEPAIGDRVVELIRRRSHRSGVVERFKVYRMDGKLYPVIRWQNGMLTFGNPEMLVVVDRPEPFSVPQRGTA